DRRGVESCVDACRSGAYLLEAQWRDEKAEARRSARGGRDDHLADAEDARDAGRVRRTGAAEPDHGIAARILAFLHQMNARGPPPSPGHPLVGAFVSSPGRQAALVAELAQTPERRPAVERHAPAEEE